MTDSVTEDPTTAEPTDEAQVTEPVEAASDEPVDDRPPRGLNPSVPPDANPEPLPIGLADMWRIARKTYRAERRYYLKLDRHRKMTSKRLSSSIFPSLKRSIFVIGAARSGTTFLGDCIGRLPEVTYHHEPPATKAAGRYVYEDLWGYRRSREFYRLVYRWLVRVERDGDLRFAEKTPTNIFLIPFLAQAFPDSQFIHIIRDGRDASSSHMHKPWLRAEDAWSGEREPGGYLHGPWPSFWVEPDRRDEFLHTSDARRMAWAWRRYTEAGLTDGPALGRRALPRAALRGPRARAGRRGREDPRLPRHQAPAVTRRLHLRHHARRRFVGRHLAQHLLPVRDGRDRCRSG